MQLLAVERSGLYGFLFRAFLLYFLFRLLLFADFETVEYLFHHLSFSNI